MKQTPQQRQDRKAYLAGLQIQAATMGAKVPKHYYLPALNRMITAGQEAKAIKTIREVFNQNPNAEFKQSFSAWWPKTAQEIIRQEIYPMIHERVNIRGLMAEVNKF